MRASPDLVLGILALVIAVLYYLRAAALPPSLLADAVGPDGLPKMYAAVLGGLALILIGRGIVAGRPRTRAGSADRHVGADAVPPIRTSTAWRPVGLWLIGATYIVLVPYLGYIPGIAALIVGTAAYQSRGLDRRTLLVGVGGAILLWLLFVQILGIAQPAGLVGEALDVAAADGR